MLIKAFFSIPIDFLFFFNFSFSVTVKRSTVVPCLGATSTVKLSLPRFRVLAKNNTNGMAMAGSSAAV